MTVISDGAIASAAKGAGLSGNAVAIAVAIALAESGGDTNSHNAIPPDNSYGLWQINMLGSMGPERRQRYGLTNNEALYDPAINAKVMVSLSNGGTNWRPWTTYTRGTYLRFMARGNAAANTTETSPNNGSSLTPVGLNDSLSGLTSLFTLLQNPRFWMRAAFLFAGVGIVFYGLMKITGDNQLSSTTKAIGGGALDAAIGLIPGGGTVKSVVKGTAKVVKG